MNEPYLIISCEHGGNDVPKPYAALFRGQAAPLESHRGWDAGALPVAQRVAAALRAPFHFTTITRLLVDTNRSSGHPALFSRFSRDLSPDRREDVLRRHYHPHRDRIRAAIDSAIGRGRAAIHLAIHSFTPVLDGVTRRTDVGLLYDSRRDKEREFCRRWQGVLAAARPDLRIHRNAPYRGSSDGLVTWLRKLHGAGSYRGIEVEINQRLVLLPETQAGVADLLVQALRSCLGASGDRRGAAGDYPARGRQSEPR